MSALKSLQELADARLALEFRQPVLEFDEAMSRLNWEGEFPVCCGEPVEIRAFLGAAYSATCKTCERFLMDVTGPEFTSGAVCLPDERYDLAATARWVCGTPEGPLERYGPRPSFDVGCLA